MSQGSIAATTTLPQEAVVKRAISHANYALCEERIEAFPNSLKDDRSTAFIVPWRGAVRGQKYGVRG
jgi:hypothetical protein